MDLRLGDYREVLADVVCNAVILDAPYSGRVHNGHNVGMLASDKASLSAYKAANGGRGCGSGSKRAQLLYDSWDQQDVAQCVDFWHPRCNGWFVSVTDHALAAVWESELQRVGRYVFPPLPFLEMGKQPRMQGDGPASWTCWIVVARPKKAAFMSWGSLPGGYVRYGSHTPDRIPGGKPLDLMRALVRDYSRPGDLVCDPCAGGGTTLLAAAQTGRRAIGAELSAETHAKALKRLSSTPVTTDLLDTLQAQQMGLL